MRILIVEDDERISHFVSKGLREAGYVVDVAEDGEVAAEKWGSVEYDLVVADIMLPEINGLELVEDFRSRGCQTPVIFLSAKREVDDRIKGFQAGGDDYMCKPFSFSELLVRVNAILRRSVMVTDAMPSKLRVGDLTLDLYSHEIMREDKKITLQPKEFSLLEYMMRNSGRIVSKTTILEHVYEYDFDPQTNVVDVLVCRLRNKIDKGFSTRMIQTVRGMGYVLRTN